MNDRCRVVLYDDVIVCLHMTLLFVRPVACTLLACILCTTSGYISVMVTIRVPGAHANLKTDCLLLCSSGRWSPSRCSTFIHAGIWIRQHFFFCSAKASHRGTSTGKLGLKGPHSPCSAKQLVRLSGLLVRIFFAEGLPLCILGYCLLS